MTPQDDAARERLDADLAIVAIVSIGIFVMTAGVGAVLVLSQEYLLNKVGNDPWLFLWVVFFAAIAVSLDLAWLVLRTSKERRYRKRDWLLVSGGVFFLAALILAIGGVASDAADDGYPSLTDVSVTSNTMTEVSFAVNADDVKKGSMIIAEVDGFRDEEAVGRNPLYRSLLRPDDKGNVNQRVTFMYKRASNVSRLTIRVRPDHEGVDGADCDASQATSKLGCATVLLP